MNDGRLNAKVLADVAGHVLANHDDAGRAAEQLSRLGLGIPTLWTKGHELRCVGQIDNAVDGNGRGFAEEGMSQVLARDQDPVRLEFGDRPHQHATLAGQASHRRDFQIAFHRRRETLVRALAIGVRSRLRRCANDSARVTGGRQMPKPDQIRARRASPRREVRCVRGEKNPH